MGEHVAVFKTKIFARFSRRHGIDDASLIEAVQRAERGLVDADLGGGLIKQRVARSGQGRSGGFRTLIAYRMRDKAIFLFGFAKNEQENISDDELDDLQTVATSWLAADPTKMQTALDDGILIEVVDGKL